MPRGKFTTARRPTKEDHRTTDDEVYVLWVHHLPPGQRWQDLKDVIQTYCGIKARNTDTIPPLHTTAYSAIPGWRNASVSFEQFCQRGWLGLHVSISLAGPRTRTGPASQDELRSLPLISGPTDGPPPRLLPRPPTHGQLNNTGTWRPSIARPYAPAPVLVQPAFGAQPTYAPSGYLSTQHGRHSHSRQPAVPVLQHRPPSHQQQHRPALASPRPNRHAAPADSRPQHSRHRTVPVRVDSPVVTGKGPLIVDGTRNGGRRLTHTRRLQGSEDSDSSNDDR